MNSVNFPDLGLAEKTLTAVSAAGYDTPTDIQGQAIPHLLAGRDVLGTAKTGTGKTAAFVLPMLQRLERAAKPTALILAPTRELALQIVESIGVYGKGSSFRTAAIYGGASRNKQLGELRRKPNILVATPGRLLDFIESQDVDLRSISYLVLDEADRMLDMGFVPAVRSILKQVPAQRQTALFSATMPPDIRSLADEFLENPIHVSADSGELRVEAIDQSVLYVDQTNKATLLPMLIRDRGMFRVLVFTRTKHKASRLAKALAKHDLQCDAIHGDKSQGARQRALANFKSGKIHVLVATDVASRGIDVDDISHVVNFELPNEPETYVHRIGRTARAGTRGVAISLCDTDEMAYLADIEKLVGSPISVDKDHPFHEDRITQPTRSGGSKRGKAPGRNRPPIGRQGGGDRRPSDGGNPREEGRSAGGGARQGSGARGKSRPGPGSTRPGARKRPQAPSNGGRRRPQR